MESIHILFKVIALLIKFSVTWKIWSIIIGSNIACFSSYWWYNLVIVQKVQNWFKFKLLFNIFLIIQDLGSKDGLSSRLWLNISQKISAANLEINFDELMFWWWGAERPWWSLDEIKKKVETSYVLRHRHCIIFFGSCRVSNCQNTVRRRHCIEPVRVSAPQA